MLYSAPTRRCSKAWLHWTQAPVTHVRRSRETTCPERTWTVAGARRKDNQRIQERGEHWPMRPQITRGSCRRVLSFLFFYMDARDGYFKKEMSSSAISCKSKYYILPPLKKRNKKIVGGRLTLYIRYVKKITKIKTLHHPKIALFHWKYWF